MKYRLSLTRSYPNLMASWNLLLNLKACWLNGCLRPLGNKPYQNNMKYIPQCLRMRWPFKNQVVINILQHQGFSASRNFTNKEKIPNQVKLEFQPTYCV